MGARRIRREQRRFDMAKSRRENGMLKTDERVRRQKRMLEIVAKGKLPYLPSVMSWLERDARQTVEADRPGRCG